MSNATEAVAEMLYDEYTGTRGKFATSTQRERWIKWAGKIQDIFADEKDATIQRVRTMADTYWVAMQEDSEHIASSDPRWGLMSALGDALDGQDAT